MKQFLALLLLLFLIFAPFARLSIPFPSQAVKPAVVAQTDLCGGEVLALSCMLGMGTNLWFHLGFLLATAAMLVGIAGFYWDLGETGFSFISIFLCFGSICGWIAILSIQPLIGAFLWVGSLTLLALQYLSRTENKRGRTNGDTHN